MAHYSDYAINRLATNPPTGDYEWTPRDPLDTTAELTQRVNALWDELIRTAAEQTELLRIPLSKGAIRTALIRAQRDTAHRANLNKASQPSEADDE